MDMMSAPEADCHVIYTFLGHPSVDSTLSRVSKGNAEATQSSKGHSDDNTRLIFPALPGYRNYVRLLAPQQTATAENSNAAINLKALLQRIAKCQ